MSTPEPLEDVVAELSADSRNGTVPRDRVLEWMRTDDIESMGAIYSLITAHFSRIHPPLEFNTYYPFALRYFERCLVENPQSEWAETRYGAGNNIIGWFVWCWRDPVQRPSTAPALKQWLATLYVSGDSEVRTCLIHATLRASV